MAKPKLEVYPLPIFIIKDAIPTLEKDGQVFAHNVSVETEKRQAFKLIERQGLPIEKYVGKTAELVLEVLDADFFEIETKDDAKKLPKDVLKGTYIWSNTGYKFIYELLDMIEGHSDDPDYDYNEDEYDELATRLFADWGNHGLGLDVYQDKPMLKTEEGIFLLNEFRNEEIIEDWELGDTIYFRPKQILLRGLNVTTKPDWRKNVKEELIAKPNELLIRGKPRIIDPW